MLQVSYGSCVPVALWSVVSTQAYIYAGWHARSNRERADMPCSKNADRPLDCWKEVELFKSEVAKVEQVSFCVLLRSTMPFPFPSADADL